MSKTRQSKRREAAKQRKHQIAESRQQKPARLQSRGLRGVRDLDGYHGLRSALKQLSDERSEWAGYPMPMDGHRLIVEPSFPNAKGLMSIGAEEPGEDDGWRMINSWYSKKRGGDIIVMAKDGGKSSYGVSPGVHHLKQTLQTLGAADAWGIEQEARAVNLLATMVRHRQFKQYMLTGMFLERSQRSGVTYLFRRLKPTVAMAPDRTKPGESMRILCALCMHPIAYYAGSWAGAMCPTDDVIGHLALMRGDERLFWSRSNQHPPHRPEAGL